MKSIEDRFWMKVKKSDHCWLWIGAKNDKGYGQIQEGRRGQGKIRAHRLSWQIENGLIPGNLHVLHRCDTPSCVRPDHLYLGTNADNHRDKVIKGRQFKKASDVECKRIRGLFALGYSIDAIAGIASIGRTQIHNIVRMTQRCKI